VKIALGTKLVNHSSAIGRCFLICRKLGWSFYFHFVLINCGRFNNFKDLVKIPSFASGTGALSKKTSSTRTTGFAAMVVTF